MINLTIDSNLYKIPTDWSEVSIETFVKIHDNYTMSTSVADLFEMIAGIPKEYSNLFNEEQLVSILYRLNYLNESIVKTEEPVFEDYVLSEINKISVGEWVDFESKLKLDDGVYILHNLLSVILKHKNTEYDSDNNSVRAEYFYKNMDIVTASSYLDIYMKTREGIFSSFKDLFDGGEEEESSGSKNVVKWGWIGFLFDLCNKDITKLEEISKMSVLLALNWSLYQNDMIKNLK